jgi:hypothetical protein
VRDREKILQGGRGIEVVAGVGNPYVDMAEIGSNGGVDEGCRAIGVRVVPIAVEDHVPGSLAADSVDWGGGRLAGTNPVGKLDNRGSRAPETLE